MNHVHAHRFHVTGQVQGVGFRWSAQEEARGLGLAGWITNEDDGSVSGFVQGRPEPVETFRRWLAHGPRGARVSKLVWETTEATALRIFTIR